MTGNRNKEKEKDKNSNLKKKRAKPSAKHLIRRNGKPKGFLSSFFI